MDLLFIYLEFGEKNEQMPIKPSLMKPSRLLNKRVWSLVKEKRCNSLLEARSIFNDRFFPLIGSFFREISRRDYWTINYNGNQSFFHCFLGSFQSFLKIFIYICNYICYIWEITSINRPLSYALRSLGKTMPMIIWKFSFLFSL